MFSSLSFNRSGYQEALSGGAHWVPSKLYCHSDTDAHIFPVCIYFPVFIFCNFFSFMILVYELLINLRISATGSCAHELFLCQGMPTQVRCLRRAEPKLCWAN